MASCSIADRKTLDVVPLAATFRCRVPLAVSARPPVPRNVYNFFRSKIQEVRRGRNATLLTGGA